MIIELGLTGNERKELVKAVSEIIGTPAEYQYMPTCAYKIGRNYERTLNRIKRIIENKGELFKAAFKTDSLEINLTEKTVEFPWFTIEQDSDADAYCTFISMLCEFAKNQSRINNKPETTDNPKYTMRCYLLRLGMIGAEYKDTRKVLLRNLSGSSAFRKAGKDDEISE